VLAATILASCLEFIDGSVVNVGLPAIGRDLRGGAEGLQWIVNAYYIPLAAFMLLGGALADAYGRRRMLMLGVAAFATCSAACALAPSLPVLIGARACQGLAAALMAPTSLSILGDAFEGEARSRAVGLWAACTTVAGALGPVIGGLLIDTAGWRAIFAINLPIAAVALIVARRAIAPGTPSAGSARFDLGGAALGASALGLLAFGLTQGAGPHGWTPGAILEVVAGVACTVGFVLLERGLGDWAMAPPAILGSRPLLALNGLTLLLYGALSAFMLLTPYRLIAAERYPAVAAGAALLPFPVVLSFGSPFIGALAGRIGPRIPLIVGALLVTAGLALTAFSAGSGGYWIAVFPGVVLVAAGMACAAAPITDAVLAAVDKRHTGVASGLNSTVAQAGGVIAIASIGGVLATHGPALDSAFRVAILGGALAALAAGGVIAFIYRGGKPNP
jgi:EmrB/QacA subfamily drug resistance transporter